VLLKQPPAIPHRSVMPFHKHLAVRSSHDACSRKRPGAKRKQPLRPAGSRISAQQTIHLRQRKPRPIRFRHCPQQPVSMKFTSRGSHPNLSVAPAREPLSTPSRSVNRKGHPNHRDSSIHWNCGPLTHVSRTEMFSLERFVILSEAKDLLYRDAGSHNAVHVFRALTTNP